MEMGIWQTRITSLSEKPAEQRAATARAGANDIGVEPPHMAFFTREHGLRLRQSRVVTMVTGGHLPHFLIILWLTAAIAANKTAYRSDDRGPGCSKE